MVSVSVQAEPAINNRIVPPPRRDVPGRHSPLPLGTLYVPDFFKSTNGTADVVVFFLGAPWCAEQNFYDARKNAVLVSVTSTNFGKLFANTNQFPSLLAETVKALKTEGITNLHHVCLSSFSGGYVAIRDILRQRGSDELITDLVLADSLYAPRVKGKTNELDPDAMTPFLDFARRAVDGKTHFQFSQLFPPEEIYRDNTTTLAAFYLTDHLDVPRRPVSETNRCCDTKILYRADQGNFHVIGQAGMNNQDHFNHFYCISELWRRLSFENAP